MNEQIKINIAGIDSNIADTLRSKHNNIKIIYKSDNNTIQLQISKSLHEDFLINTLDEFLNNFNSIKKHEIIPSWFFDENNSSINAPDCDFQLTKKEVLFLKMLISNDKIITYKKMISTLWDEEKNVSQNAMRLFTRNIKKKLPPNILKNYHNKGYKLLS
ncbi:MAG: helix-turn-helix domain-containing protein [Campylobacteraceae bacterium]|nr:helix-turn-helix domain-containing protein [Campylobacteraceae bacterium]